MKSIRAVSLLIVIFISFDTAIFPQTTRASSSDSELSAKISEYLKPIVESDDLSGTLLVARGSDVIFEKSYGMANYELKVANTPQTRFCIASVSKPITQIIFFDLLEKGKLDVKDPLSKWIPDFPRGNKITVEHLLKHSSGIPHRITTSADQIEPQTPADMVEFAKKAKLLHEPGSQSGYSSGGYSVLARILELSGGKPFDELLEQIVFRPVGASQTVHPFGRYLILNRAQGYFQGADSPIHAPLQNLSYLVGAGSLFSTPQDLHKIARGIINGSYGDRCKQNMIRKEGLSWNGYTNGYRAFVNYHIDQDLYVIFAGNLFTGASELIKAAIPQIASGKNVPRPVIPAVKPIIVSIADQNRFEGSYELKAGNMEELRFQGPSWATLGDWILIANGKDSFFSPQDYTTVNGVTGSDGSIVALQWGEPGKGPRFAKIENK